MGDKKTKVTRLDSENISLLLLSPVLNLIDGALQDDDLFEKLSQLKTNMKQNQSTAQAVSGMLLDMEEVDKRELLLKTFIKFVELVEARKYQIDETARLVVKQKSQQIGMSKLRNAMGF